MAKIESTIEQRIEEMTRRIVERFQPERVILFGSHGRGEAEPDSDVDILVVMPLDKPKREQAMEISLAVQDFDLAKDILVTTPEDYAWRKEVTGTIEYPTAHEGKVLYAKP